MDLNLHPDALHDPLGWVQARPLADPVRQRVLEGLARRAATQAGPLRERLVARMVQRAEAGDTGAERHRLAPSPRGAQAPSALAMLLAALPPAGPELRQVQAHRRTWSALRLTRRMAEVSAPVPEHLGPLNSQVLVARALQELKHLSPDYLQRLLTQLDTLAALAPLQPVAEGDKPARSGTRKAAPRKR
ncbi:DUF2894 domain-containing protein [Roseateles sp. BYS87W]|uniref:DUF2894 domain-containing protein n=1 Tax=Pelomonas baiyunensis TaxID=3299026 RepID=A0ABW7H1D7_9BURK